MLNLVEESLVAGHVITKEVIHGSRVNFVVEDDRNFMLNGGNIVPLYEE